MLIYPTFRLPNPVDVVDSFVRSACPRYRPRRTGPPADPQASGAVRQQLDRYGASSVEDGRCARAQEVLSTTPFSRAAPLPYYSLRRFRAAYIVIDGRHFLLRSSLPYMCMKYARNMHVAYV